MKRMIALDGAQGEGGGQILRSALSKTGTVAPASDRGKSSCGNL